MIRIEQLKLPVEHTRRELEHKIRRQLRLRAEEPLEYEIRKRSLDARRKPELYYSYTIDCHATREQKLVRRAGDKRLNIVEEKNYCFPQPGTAPMANRPVIVGTGPAGLFCGLLLAEHGYRPLLLERGQDVDTRLRDVALFWESGKLNPQSNVQFGEGGAGTFSDGKLNTLVHDRDGRNREVLRRFVAAGADPSILYESKPHIGTDVLAKVVKNMRKEIEVLGGNVRFGAQVTGILTESGRLTGLVINQKEELPCETAVFAIGHSARNTFQMLYERGISMEAKEFAAGFRVEHKQRRIDLSQYGREDPAPLSAASYKLAAKAANGRSVYSFCMCPGGYVVNASSEAGRLAVNGMSYSGRSGENANSAIIVSVKKDDFPSEHPLAGIQFQRTLEEAAYRAGGGAIPVQRLGDFRETFWQRKQKELSGMTADVFAGRTDGVLAGRTGQELSENDINPANMAVQIMADREIVETDGMSLTPCMKGKYRLCDITKILPPELTEAFLDGMEQFSHKIAGFADDEVLVSAVESRTSSPVRILRDESLQSNIEGLYPCGEGAGYAGGITSAAMDGVRVAEAVTTKYRPFEEKRG